jgi:hypothetical protein
MSGAAGGVSSRGLYDSSEMWIKDAYCDRLRSILDEFSGYESMPVDKFCHDAVLHSSYRSVPDLSLDEVRILDLEPNVAYADRGTGELYGLQCAGSVRKKPVSLGGDWYGVRMPLEVAKRDRAYADAYIGISSRVYRYTFYKKFSDGGFWAYKVRILYSPGQHGTKEVSCQTDISLPCKRQRLTVGTEGDDFDNGVPIAVRQLDQLLSTSGRGV